MSQILALLGSSAASGAGESFLWEGINELTLSQDTQYINYTVSSAPYSTYDALWFRMALRLSLIHIRRCRRSTLCRSRWSPYH